MRLPAFGRQLWSLRDAGQHPPRVWVLAGDDWDRAPFGDGYVLGLSCDVDPRRVDWRLLVGLPVHIVARGHPQVWALACLAARRSAPVVLHADVLGFWSSLYKDGAADAEGVDWPPVSDRYAQSFDIEHHFPLTRDGAAPLADWTREDEADYSARRWDWLLETTAKDLREAAPREARVITRVLRERREGCG